MNARTIIIIAATTLLCAMTGMDAWAGAKTKIGCASKTIEIDHWSTSRTVEGVLHTYGFYHQTRSGRLEQVSVTFEPRRGFVPGDAARHLAGRPLPESDANYILQAERDPYAGTYLRPLVDALVTQAERMGENPIALMLSLIQGIPYSCRPHQAWPTEVLLQNACGLF